MATHRNKEYKHLNFNTSLIEPELYVGARYVFFDSLRGSPPPQPTSFYNNIANIGSSLVDSAAAQLKIIGKPDSIVEGLSKIQQYINFIGEVAENEQGNEINFIKQMNEYLKKDEELQKNFNKFLNGIENRNGFDYLQLMNLINEIMREKEKLKAERDKINLNNMKLISSNYKKANKEIKKEILALFEEKKIDLLNKSINHNLLNPIRLNQYTSREFQTPLNEKIGKQITSILYHLADNEKLNDIIIEQITGQGWNKDQLFSYILAIVVQYVEDLDYQQLSHKSGEELANEIVENFQNLSKNIKQDALENAEKLFTAKNQVSNLTLEEVALTTRRGLTAMFQKLSKTQREKYLDKYDTNSKLRNLLEQRENGALSETRFRDLFTKALGNSIRQYFQNLNFKPNGTTTQAIRKEVINFMQNNAKNFDYTKIKTLFYDNFQIETTGSTVAEYISAHSSEIAKAIFFGNKIKFKTDISITYNFNDFQKLNFISENDSQLLEEKLNNFFLEFLNKYKEENKNKKQSSETTDIESAAIAYEKEMQEIYDIVQKIIEEENLDAEQQKELLNNFSNFLLNSITVKDYNYYVNELGFHGGSLGGGGTPENVINNIEAMYELGGISPIDKDLLLFAAINCGPDGFAKGLKEDLANYLLGGAAMIMFDDGFTAANAFLDRMKQEFSFSIPSLHLYRLNGIYIPASYIYSNIHKNLQQVYGLLSTETNLSNINHNNKVIINNNITEAKTKPHWGLMPSPQQRWDFVSEAALSEVQITFVFMAGLLDIFEQIPKAFNNV